jgi:hypothetical protein
LVKEGVVGDDRCELNMLAGGFITMDAKKIIIGDGLRNDQVYLGNNATEPVVLGAQLVSYLNSLVTALNGHTHSITAFGPTTPPEGPAATAPGEEAASPSDVFSGPVGIQSAVAFTK